MSTITPLRQELAAADAPQLFTAAEVARYLRVSTMTVYRLLERGELVGARVGRAYRVSRQDLAAYLDAAKVA